jgi:hypothetical protein
MAGTVLSIRCDPSPVAAVDAFVTAQSSWADAQKPCGCADQLHPSLAAKGRRMPWRAKGATHAGKNRTMFRANAIGPITHLGAFPRHRSPPANL